MRLVSMLPIWRYVSLDNRLNIRTAKQLSSGLIENSRNVRFKLIQFTVYIPVKQHDGLKDNCINVPVLIIADQNEKRQIQAQNRYSHDCVVINQNVTTMSGARNGLRREQRRQTISQTAFT